jgi:hypothetical protein
LGTSRLLKCCRACAARTARHAATLGEYPKTTLEAARSLANAYLDQAKKGVSPARALENSATAGGLTVKALSERFLSEYVQMRELRAVLKYAGALRVHVIPRIGDVLADTLSREQVCELLRKVMIRVPRKNGPRDRRRGGKEAARTVLAVLRKMISWGISEELLRRRDNAASGMESNLPKKRKKERVLSLDEARIVWRAAETSWLSVWTRLSADLADGLPPRGVGEGAASVGSISDKVCA